MRRLPSSFRKRWNFFRLLIRGITPGTLTARDLPFLLRQPDPVILDIGCNDGAHTEMFLELFPGSRVFSFEPDPRARQRFQARIKNSRAELIPIALGSVEGDVVFHASSGDTLGNSLDPTKPRDWDASGSIREPFLVVPRNPKISFENKISVPIRTLDRWAAEKGLERIDFIWADVQGAETDLISGGKRMLRRTHFFYTEYNDEELYAGQANFRQLSSMLPEFRCLRRYPEDALFENRRWP